MLAFTDLFFKTKYTAQSSLQMAQGQQLLETLYKEVTEESKRRGENPSKFVQQKKELLRLLTHYIDVYPELTLFQRYRENVEALSENAAKIDLDITLKAAKNLLERMIGIFGQRKGAVDQVKFNSYEVSACYQGAYSNLAQAFSLFEGNQLSMAVVDLKQELIYGLAAAFIASEDNDFLAGHEIHDANALVSAVSDKYGIPKPIDYYVSNILLGQIDKFKTFLIAHLKVHDFIEFIARKAPELPSTLIDANDEKKFRIEQKRIEHFFEWLGEKTVPDHALRKLYTIEEHEGLSTSLSREEANTVAAKDEVASSEDDTFVYRLVPQKNQALFQRCLVAEYLEQQGYLKGVSRNVGQYKLVSDGKTVVALDAEKGYRRLSQEDILFLLQDKVLKDETLVTTWLFNQLSVGNLKRIFDNEVHVVCTRPRERSFYALLRRKQLSYDVSTAICHRLLKQDFHILLKKQFLDYVLCNPSEPLPNGLTGLALSLNLRLSEGVNYLMQAIEQDCVSTVRFLLETFPLLDMWREEDMSPLHFAIRFRSMKVIDFFIREVGIDVDDTFGEGITPLQVVAEIGDVEVLQKLVSLGAELNKARSDGLNPILLAAYWGQIECLKKLKDLGADLKATTKDGSTLAHIVIESHCSSDHRIEVLSELLSWGVPIDQTNKMGITPIMGATIRGTITIFIMLREAGANLEKVDKEGNGCMHMAAMKGNTAMLTLLASAELDLNQKNNRGFTPAHLAVENGHLPFLRTLEKLGGNLDHSGHASMEMTPAFLAASMGHVGIVRFLMHKASFRLPVIRDEKEWLLYVRDYPLEIKTNMHKKISERMEKGDGREAIQITPRDIAEVLNHTRLVEQMDKSEYSQWHPFFSSLFKVMAQDETRLLGCIGNGLWPS